MLRRQKSNIAPTDERCDRHKESEQTNFAGEQEAENASARIGKA
jgi:hypothetical protein